jgi:orotidine-5'-phosphate decarboxylase
MAHIESKIIVALDGLGIIDNYVKWAERLAPYVAGFKVNDALDICGVGVCKVLKQFGEVMADPKLHDIPATMRNRATMYASAGVDYLTVHAGNTLEALIAAREVAPDVQILGVTILTSYDEGECAEIYYDRGHRRIRIDGKNPSHVEQKVLDFTRNATKATLDGIVCSAKDLEFLSRESVLKGLLTVPAGIRIEGTESHDQKRCMTPRDAARLGAHRIVVGRDILKAVDPIAATEKINEEMARGRCSH